jgi:hypothetical protein|tara:strand:+ start:3572 stop:3907 length:336 start_codon:yes stop_codon:yes gene_type:complete
MVMRLIVSLVVLSVLGVLALGEVPKANLGKFHVEGGNTYVVIPTDNEMLFPDGKITAKGYLLGISSDRGKTWMFADEAGIKDKTIRAKVLPKLPRNLKLPKPAMPKIIKDN